MHSQQNGRPLSKGDPLRGADHEELEMNEISPGDYKPSAYDSIQNAASGSHSLGDDLPHDRPSTIKANGPTSLPFNPEHFANVGNSNTAKSRSAPANYKMSVHKGINGPPSYEESRMNGMKMSYKTALNNKVISKMQH